MRLAIYTDYVYRRVDGSLYAERAFALFAAALRPHVQALRFIGRLAPGEELARYALPPDIELAPLPHYTSLTKPVAVLASLARSGLSMWRALDEVDVVWILGPYPHAIVITVVALARRRTVVLGVRQDWPRYVRMRRPTRRWMHRAADLLEFAWRGLARRLPVVAVGHELAANYAHSPALLELAVSLVRRSLTEGPPPERSYAGVLNVLSVGRLEEEKNPLLLADVLAKLAATKLRWRLVVCGEGDLEPALRERLSMLGVAGQAELVGYVPMGERLLDLYRSSHAFLHVSWTEGFPQVLIEAFATGLPVVATDVGGVAAGVGDAGLLIPPGDAQAAADALVRLSSDRDLRARLTAAARAKAERSTLETQIETLASFLEAAHVRRARTRRKAS